MGQVGHTNVYVQSAATNGLGTAGFVVSLLGLLTLGCLSPIGLLFSLIALAKPPRGMAIAGTVLGVIGSVFLFAVGGTIILGCAGMGAAISAVGNRIADEETAIVCYQTIQASPKMDPAKAIANASDRNGKRPVYTKTESGFTITLSGDDRISGTADDVVFSSADIEHLVKQRSPASLPTTTR